MNTRDIKAKLAEANETGRYLYAKNTVMNTIGLIDLNWQRVFSARTKDGRPQVNVQSAWRYLAPSVEFSIR